VVPIIIMAYMATGSIIELDNLTLLKTLLVDNGWTWVTAVSTMLFCLIHWPCSTTCMTIKKETQSMKWTILSFVLPTLIGMIVCFIFTSVVRLLGLG
ncbi:MAG: ferrous iron transporter B, partial [Oscillospiraceae bacterium]